MADFRHRDLQGSDVAELRRQLNAELSAIERALRELGARRAVSAVQTADYTARFGEVVRVAPPAAGLRVILPPATLGKAGDRVVVVVEGDDGALTVEAVDTTVNGAETLAYAASVGTVEFVLTEDGWFGWSSTLLLPTTLFGDGLTYSGGVASVGAVAGARITVNADDIAWAGFDLNVNGAVGSTGWIGIDIIDTATVTWATSVPGGAFLGLALNVPDEAITNAKIAHMAQATIKLRASGAGTGDPTDGTITQALDMMASGSTRGSLPLRGASAWASLTPGSSGTFLRGNGSGADPSYANAGLLRTTVLTSGSGATFNHLSGARICRIRGVGGGGGGGGTNAAAGACGANGGSGTYGERTFTITASTSTYTVGGGGVGNSGAAGNAGQQSTWLHGATTTTLPAGGGGAALAGGATIARAAGGAGGGAATNADMSVAGMVGGDVVRTAAATTPIFQSSPAGSTPIGNGGRALQTSTTFIAGEPGTGYGSGGSGRVNGTTATAAAGADGAGGVWIVEEFS